MSSGCDLRLCRATASWGAARANPGYVWQVAFYHVLSKFGMSDPKWKNVESVLPDKTREEILAYVAVFMLHLTDASLGIFAHLSGPLSDEGVSARATLRCVHPFLFF